jgi:hypothetical protein
VEELGSVSYTPSEAAWCPGAIKMTEMTHELQKIGLPGTASMVGYELPRLTDLKTWLEIGKQLEELHETQSRRLSAVYWWVGDWLVFGEEHFGEEHSQALDEITANYRDETLRNMAWVASRIPRVSRLTDLSWSKHQAAAALSAPDQEEVLNAAVEEGWSVNRIRDEVKQRRRRKAFVEPAQSARLSSPSAATDVEVPREAPPKDDLPAYHAVYASPKWRLSDLDEGDTTEDLKSTLDGVKIAQDAVCFIWSHPAKLANALEVMAAWGFKLKTCAVRVRELGDYLSAIDRCLWFRPAHEVLLVGGRGILPPVDAGDLMPSVVNETAEALCDTAQDWFGEGLVYRVGHASHNQNQRVSDERKDV